MGILGQLLPFAAIVIGEENKTARIYPFEQNDARRGAAIFIGRGQSHGVDVYGDAGFSQENGFVEIYAKTAKVSASAKACGLLEPSVELDDRISIEISAAETAQAVFPSEIGQRHKRSVEAKGKKLKCELII